MRNIAEMAQRVHPPALVLLDEVGTGTDPDEGGALAIAIVEFFRRRALPPSHPLTIPAKNVGVPDSGRAKRIR